MPPHSALGGADRIALPAPRTEGGLPLMSCLSRRRSSRAFRRDEPTLQEISEVLWSACGTACSHGPTPP
jgi:hypothetical protein